MIPIGDLPILWHIMKYYACFGHHHFVLCLGYKGEVIKDFFVNYRNRISDFTLFLNGKREPAYYNDFQEAAWSVTLSETGLNAMTGSRVRKIRKYIDGDTFFLTYGDGVGDVDLNALLEFHKSHGKIMTVTCVQPPSRFGELSVDELQQVRGFNEKPQARGGHISGGFFVCSTRIFDYLPAGDDLVLEREPMEALVRDSEMMAYLHDGFWQPMDTAREYQLLNRLVSQGEAPWMVW
jgi:glucose-1-phosphate cytidylyltransferase